MRPNQTASTARTTPTRGSDGDDYLHGGDSGDELRGGDGADDLIDGAGNDRIRGEDQNDNIIGGGGKDKINAGNKDKINGGGGNDNLPGSPWKEPDQMRQGQRQGRDQQEVQGRQGLREGQGPEVKKKNKNN